ncbi:hypothetical protein DNTS_027211 [Danionella cerebrum]|uniref:MANSC domain-containing protein n=1 Tax=Danionella cerebrum TaxID=2873325 RepID=A0A553QNE6_9TELE|nr:hypothetical protein DNTS_027211 [Danionella translucida]
MAVPWTLLCILGLIRSTFSSCSLTSYYRSCWIRRFPGVCVEPEECVRKGASLLRVYREESAVQCSRACCITPNFSCSLAVFHFNTTQESVNCFHLQCPTLESCTPHRRGNVILYNVTKGVDPDLLVFGKYFTTNVRVLPHMSSTRLNTSEPLTSDKRQFNYPPNPPVWPISLDSSTKKHTTPLQTMRPAPGASTEHQNLPSWTSTSATAENTSEPTLKTTTTATPQWVPTNPGYTKETDSTVNTLNENPLLVAATFLVQMEASGSSLVYDFPEVTAQSTN